MEPMKPMTPMQPMERMSDGGAWWPESLGQPASSGGQNGMRYAFFPDSRRLVVERNRETTTYDSGDHRIGGVSQQSGSSQSVTFTSQHGPVELDSLQKVG